MDETLLKRVRHTATQVNLTAQERAENVKHAFSAGNAEGKNILLLDDVRTTGATLSECAQVLRKVGAKHVYTAAACARD